MLAENFKQWLKETSIASLGVFSGAGLALVLMQYPGIVELRVNAEEGYFLINGGPKCQVPVEMEENNI